MVQNDCGEIPIIDTDDHVIGVVTDRDIVCRVVAEGQNPMGYTADTCMSQPVVTVDEDAPLDEVVATMEKHQIRRVPVVANGGCCAGIISQADVARAGPTNEVADLAMSRRPITKHRSMRIIKSSSTCTRRPHRHLMSTKVSTRWRAS